MTQRCEPPALEPSDPPADCRDIAVKRVQVNSRGRVSEWLSVLATLPVRLAKPSPIL